MNRSWMSHSKNMVLSALSFPTARRAVVEATAFIFVFGRLCEWIVKPVVSLMTMKNGADDRKNQE